MKRRIKQAVAITTLVLTTTNPILTQACDRGGPRLSISRGPLGIGISPIRRASTPVYHKPVLAQPTYGQPAYSQPHYAHSAHLPNTHGHPGYAQPGVGQPLPGQMQSANSSNNASAQVVRQASSAAIPPSRPPATPATASQTTATQPTGAQPTATQPTATQPTAAQPTTTQLSPEASALQLLASITGDQSISEEGTSPVAEVPAIPEFGPASSASLPAHVGTWTVNLPGNQSVELVLNDDGTFRWTATKDGNSSQFQGQYRLESGRLTLVRSNDLQQMTGNWTNRGDQFTFKLDGATTGGLDFSRS